MKNLIFIMTFTLVGSLVYANEGVEKEEVSSKKERPSSINKKKMKLLMYIVQLEKQMRLFVVLQTQLKELKNVWEK